MTNINHMKNLSGKVVATMSDNESVRDFDLYFLILVLIIKVVGKLNLKITIINHMINLHMIYNKGVRKLDLKITIINYMINLHMKIVITENVCEQKKCGKILKIYDNSKITK